MELNHGMTEGQLNFSTQLIDGVAGKTNARYNYVCLSADHTRSFTCGCPLACVARARIRKCEGKWEGERRECVRAAPALGRKARMRRGEHAMSDARALCVSAKSCVAAAERRTSSVTAARCFGSPQPRMPPTAGSTTAAPLLRALPGAAHRRTGRLAGNSGQCGTEIANCWSVIEMQKKLPDAGEFLA
eukprot:6184112-Pleurochrysis_carterae.AAC.3